MLCVTSTPELFELTRHERARPDQRDARAPSLSKPKMFERATRLKRMSPMIATCSPGDRPFFRES